MPETQLILGSVGDLLFESDDFRGLRIYRTDGTVEIYLGLDDAGNPKLEVGNGTDTAAVGVDGTGGYVTPNNLISLFTQTAAGADYTNSVVRTELAGTGEGSLNIPANTLAVGDVIRMRGTGVLTSDGNTLTWYFSLDTNTISRTIATNTTSNPIAYHFDCTWTIRTIGAAATVYGVCYFTYDVGAGIVVELLIDTSTIDTTGIVEAEIDGEWLAADTNDIVNIQTLSLYRDTV